MAHTTHSTKRARVGEEGGVADWLRCRVSNHARSTRVGSNPVVGTTNHNPTVNSAVHPSEVGKGGVLRSNSEGKSTGHTLITTI